MIKKLNIYFGAFMALLFLSTSCADDVMGTIESIPTAFGRVNEVTVLADQIMWEGPVGDTLDYYYTSAFPITPTPEPILDIRHFNYDQVSGRKVLKHYRNYIILANLGDKDSELTKMVVQDIGQDKYRKALKDPTFNTIVGKNKWAKGQILIYVFAPTESQLIDALRTKFPDIVQRIYAHDYDQIVANTYAGKENIIAQNTIKEILNFKSKVPGEFQVAKKSIQDKMVWLRKDDKESFQCVVIRNIPYESDRQFDQENIIGLIEDFGAKHIENNKLLVNDRDLPIYEYVKNKDQAYTKELRGIWETKEGFMGGPYIAYLTKEEGSDNLIFSFGFIYAAGSEKRNLLQRLEVIMNEVHTLGGTN